MRLVCDKCSAVYTIESHLVGDRDFQVSCKECGAPIVVKQARSEQAGSSSPLMMSAASLSPVAVAPAVAVGVSSRPPSSFTPVGDESWFVWVDGVQRGPHAAAEIAALIEKGQMNWTTQVWREGFKDWRAARRDSVLVTAVAGARGVAGDTMRLDSARSFLVPSGETIVEQRPELSDETEVRKADPSGSERISEPGARTSHDTIVSRVLPEGEGAPLADRGSAPSLSPREPPKAWATPENAAFRAGLGLPLESREASLSPSARARAASPTLAEAFRSAPNLMNTGSPESTAGQATGGQEATESWVPKPRSLMIVALLAFGAGVLAAAVGSQVSKPVEKSAPRLEEPPAAVVEPILKETPSDPPKAPLSAITTALRELPDPDELRGEVRRVAPDVRRCVDASTMSVNVDIYLDGPSGRVRDVAVRPGQISSGRVECVVQAVRQIRLPPFTRAELKLTHKFSF